MSHKELGLKCGIEIHQQLEGKKLFCSCPTLIRDDQPDFVIRRKLRASAGESGKIDIAAQQEQLRDKTFIYQGYDDTTCLVETDSEPPHEINKDAFYTSLQFCRLVSAEVSPVIQVMRKTVVDGSNTSGFQRTALIARDGSINTSEGKVGITNISLEEDSCKIVSESYDEKTYSLDRLGIPLIEIGTAPDIKTPLQCQETAKKLGLLLRSLPGVKRGLGTIRQDVNVSIKGGERIEIKGAQDLRQLPLLVEMEMKRQHELLQIKKELKGLRLNKLEIIDVSKAVKKSSSKIIKNVLEKKGKILGIRLKGFTSLLGRELQPGYRLGTELAGRAKIKAGVGGIIHSDEYQRDEPKKYGLNIGIISEVEEKLGIKNPKKDAYILVAAQEGKAKIALESAYERVEELFKGIPKEVRKANADGTTSFLRPMPGAARMYPETDIPLIRPDLKIELPELLEDKFARFEKKYHLSPDLAEFIAKSAKVSLFEELAKKYSQIKPAFIAETLTSTLLEIKRKYDLDPEKLTDDHFRELFRYLSEDKIHKDIVLDVLIEMIKGTFDINKYASLGTEEIHKELLEIIDRNKGAPFPALMGMAMKKLNGKASGKFISQELRKILDEGHK